MAGTETTFRFSKNFDSQTCLRKMELPITEMEFVKMGLPNKVLLRNPLKEIWIVEISKTKDRVFLKKGWTKFVDDNSLENGDRLDFFSDTCGIFDVVPVQESNLEMAIVKYADENVEDVKPNISANSKDKKNVAGQSKKRTFDAGEDSTDAKIKDIPDHYGADLFKSGEYTQPTNPYFVTKIRTKRRDYLYVPMDVVKDYKLEFSNSLILRDPKGKDFIGKVKIWGDGRTWMTGGWRSLCRWNLIEQEDRCICEFLPPFRNGGDVVLQVTIVRAKT